jgi:hypothetical protein
MNSGLQSPSLALDLIATHTEQSSNYIDHLIAPPRRLGIIVPYRDRAEHLFQIIPHLATYFTRDKLDSDLSVNIIVVEQPAGAPFNRGLMCNIGYKLLCDSIDYVCFHDVDYLPIWADYRCPDRPTMIIWHGFESRPLDPAQPQVRLLNKIERCFSAVVLIRKEEFEQVNGYPVQYWGWGPEDGELKLRFEHAGYGVEHRKGTFMALDHVNAGYDIQGRPTPAHRANQARLDARWQDGKPKYDWRVDGLSSTQFGIIGRWPLGLPPDTRANIRAERVLVTIPHHSPM